ncbi:MAG: nicotinate-nucleotide adenylyltransferase [Clostridiales bacterium]|nr:nicotinate-nucleotide adenylyltransferase [Clostridiales bacterium]
MKKIGVLGGTFNPIHNGHIMLSQYCKEKAELDEIILIPSFTPPHKTSSCLADSEHRLNMCRLACEGLEGYTVSDIEIKRKGKSYTYQTLELLKENRPDDRLYFIMGADMFLTLDKWRNPVSIFRSAVMTAIPRNKSDYSDLFKYYESVIKPMGAEALILPDPVMQVSSTFIRKNIHNFDILKTLIDKNVYEYIVKNKLYRM